jgi:hypothetical protein
LIVPYSNNYTAHEESCHKRYHYKSLLCISQNNGAEGGLLQITDFSFTKEEQ